MIRRAIIRCGACLNHVIQLRVQPFKRKTRYWRVRFCEHAEISYKGLCFVLAHEHPGRFAASFKRAQQPVHIALLHQFAYFLVLGDLPGCQTLFCPGEGGKVQLVAKIAAHRHIAADSERSDPFHLMVRYR
ncbi:hypothetical protein D3C75_929990 [compost metagenome]